MTKGNALQAEMILFMENTLSVCYALGLYKGISTLKMTFMYSLGVYKRPTVLVNCNH